MCHDTYNDMNTDSDIQRKDDLDVFARFIHLGMLTFGLLAYLASGWAEDYEKAQHLGFTVHKWLGILLAAFIALRLIYGIIGPKVVRFTQWVPYTKERWLNAWEDVLTLLRFRLPDRPVHEGVAGIVQTFGLLVFTWMALTGSLMFFLLKPGQEARGVVHAIEEIHEIGKGLIPIFLVLHVGAVILHALSGRHIWRKMIFLKE
jgi:cytochrome b